MKLVTTDQTTDRRTLSCIELLLQLKMFEKCIGRINNPVLALSWHCHNTPHCTGMNRILILRNFGKFVSPKMALPTHPPLRWWQWNDWLEYPVICQQYDLYGIVIKMVLSDSVNSYFVSFEISLIINYYLHWEQS